MVPMSLPSKTAFLFAAIFRCRSTIFSLTIFKADIFDAAMEIADDAILIDTGRMDLAEVVKTLAAHIGGKNVL
jgi:hypothetical protein